ncbi:MAG: UDP-N-acetylmuramoyl-tripeptide--D-alanyl-D-alanine ligase [Acidimicrobiales bacterium]|nr:MAG: Mur ligase family protein [Actinomycetota bacterium]MBV6507000.1 UDP-N-acetylmuramoyl-tripeptide--D-alanyl-D-alanine ligase [Acidimicrobiales bacterium]RIK05812.1 MAG: DUF1727 domain-containing protein [Acidobacteriota bacterium]
MATGAPIVDDRGRSPVRALRLFVIWLGKILVVLARLRGGGGSALPGLVVQRLRPRLLGELAGELRGGCVVVTGTNGKTTSVKMLSLMLSEAGYVVLTNRTGSNMVRGLLSTLVEQATWTGRLPFDIGVFEVDEGNVAPVAAAVAPRVAVVLNLLRDQLDRYGELERTAELISGGLPAAQAVVLNGDDRLVAGLGSALGGPVHFFGASDELRAALPDDAGLLTGERARERVVPQSELAVELTRADTAGLEQVLELRCGSVAYPARLPMPGVYNAYNAAACICAMDALGEDVERAAEALSGMRPAFGRGEPVEVDGVRIVLQLVKNPSGLNQVIHTLLAVGPPRRILFAINDNIADGRDVSWLWDVDFEALAGRGDTVVASGIRGTDLALRLKYAEVPSTADNNLAGALDEFVKGTDAGEVAYVVPTYTAMLDLRKLLRGRAELKEMWE